MPLLIAAPGMTAGQTCALPVELVDLYPTLADLCGILPPAGLEGLSLKPLLENPQSIEWVKPAVTQVWHSPQAWGYSLRTSRWRYTEWLEGRAGRELYDHANDPEEIHNLALREEWAGKVRQLSDQLRPYVQLQPQKRVGAKR